MKFTWNSRGVSIVEALIGIVVLGFITSVGISIMVGTRQQLDSTNMRLRSRTNVSAIVESIMENTGQYVRFFTILKDSERDQYLAYERLNIRFNDEGLFDETSCPNCEGRIGYLIEPHPTLPGFFVVTVDVYSKADEKKRYRFISGEI